MYLAIFCLLFPSIGAYARLSANLLRLSTNITAGLMDALLLSTVLYYRRMLEAGGGGVGAGGTGLWQKGKGRMGKRAFSNFAIRI